MRLMLKSRRAPTEQAGAPPATDQAAPTAGKRPRLRRGQRVWLGFGVVVLVAAALIAVGERAGSNPKTNTAEINGMIDKKVSAAIDDLQNQPAPGVPVYDTAVPALVVVQSTHPTGPGLGSGVVVNADGDVMTSLHVVDGATSIKLTFSDGTNSTATVSSTDADHDIAVLTPAQLPQTVVPAVLGGGAHVGDQAFVVGNPLGLVGSLSAGVISGLDRPFKLPSGKTINGLIQFDAAVNPGNSGGPLLNRNGQVIGIVAGLANSSGDDNFSGIGFAVPIGTAGGAAGAPPK